MSTLAQLLRQYQDELISQYSSRLQPKHYAAMNAIMTCHTSDQSQLQYQCPACEQRKDFYRSCGNRNCPACQHQTNQQWLERQRRKLLPVDYFMVTFTLPREMHRFAWHYQAWAYNALIACAVETLNGFAQRDQRLSGTLGITAVLHTHSRKLDYHPHVHLIVPNGGFNKNRRLWRQKSGRYLFNGMALAKVFKEKFLAQMDQAGFYIPKQIPKKWVAQCQRIGNGEPALVYLARYLYRGVINEKHIVQHQDGTVSFRYKDSKTKSWKTRTQSAAQFLWLILQHALPKGFRRTRDYGFLHGNAKKNLAQLQLMLRVSLPEIKPLPDSTIGCPCCGFSMQFIGMIRRGTKNIALSRS